MNKSFCEYFEKKPNEFLEVDVTTVVYPDDYSKVMGSIKSLSFDKPVATVENRVIRSDGTVRRHQWVNRALFDDQKILYGYQSIGQDITDKHNLQEQLLQQNKMDAIGKLAGGVAHDFNNVLAGIMNAAELLVMSGSIIDEKGKKYVDIINKASTRASDLIAKLLTFSRKSNVDLNIVDIHDILDDVLDIFKRTIDRKIALQFIKKADYSTVMGNPSALENIFINLGINSSHAIKSAGEIRITTSNISFDEEYCSNSPFEIVPGEYVKIEVEDDGSGIPGEDLNRIFEPFFTTKDQSEGTGMGLAAVYGTVQDHNGIVDVQSTMGVGSIFSVYLPFKEKVTSVEEPMDEDILTGSGNILLVDDEEINRITGSDLLENLGYKVFLASDGHEALELFREKYEQIDLIIMDLIMPVIGGSEAFAEMREIDPKCRVILASGYTRDEDISELKEKGLAGFIYKPFNISEMSKLIKRVMT